MRWERGHESPDVIDARGRSAGAGPASGLGMLLHLGARFGWKGVLVALLLMGAMAYFANEQVGVVGEPGPAAHDEKADFVGFVLDDVQSTWAEILPEYRRAKLVLFRGSVPTGCGAGQAATGPFYCPLDERVYIDLSFYDELSARFGAPGDFAEAYVIAHEIGHHVQHLLGADQGIPQGRRAQGATGPLVRLELQADCYAGVWAAAAARRNLLEPGDIEEGLRAAAAIGDDRLQRQGMGTVSPETFTHGTSEQRMRWLRRGFEGGTPASCDTLSARGL